jgi:hypothetical protein
MVRLPLGPSVRQQSGHVASRALSKAAEWSACQIGFRGFTLPLGSSGRQQGCQVASRIVR